MAGNGDYAGLSMWVVYDHPRDYPNSYVARLWRGETPTESVIICKDITVLREMLLAEMHLVRLDRMPNDEPQIMEVWL